MWLRVGLLHPVLFVGPWVALSHFLAARPGSDIDDIWWGLYLIPLCALLSVAVSIGFALKRLEGPSSRVAGVLVAVASGALALFIGAGQWGEAATIACHGRYECPF